MYGCGKIPRLAVVLLVCLAVPACKSKVTKANLDKIKPGMSLEEVEKILGKGSKQEGDGSGVAGQFGVAIQTPPTTGGGAIYLWESPSSSITVIFNKENKVVSATSKGL